MKVLRRVWVSGIIFSIIFVFASCLLAQEAEQETTPAAPAETGVTGANAATETPAEAQPTEWVWGEVVSVDQEKKQIVLKHLDYDTYEEVQITLNVGDKTLLENVAGLGEIRAGNHLTADFKIVAGSNIADLVVVEKDVQEESVAPETAVVPVSVPEAPAQAVNETAPSI